MRNRSALVGVNYSLVSSPRESKAWDVDGTKTLAILASTLLSTLHKYKKPIHHFKRESDVCLIPNTVSDAQIFLSRKHIMLT
jgi:hypothetical protein